jgi:biopolymer transport protein ExbD
MRFVQRHRRQPTINIVSLIDILCILLIFFVVTTVFRSEEPVIKIELPETTDAKPAEGTPPTLIFVSPDERVFIGRNEVPVAELVTTLTQMKNANGELRIAMKADKKAPFGLILKVMNASRKAGFSDLPTFTDPAKKEP